MTQQNDMEQSDQIHGYQTFVSLISGGGAGIVTAAGGGAALRAAGGGSGRAVAVLRQGGADGAHHPAGALLPQAAGAPRARRPRLPRDADVGRWHA